MIVRPPGANKKKYAASKADKHPRRARVVSRALDALTQALRSGGIETGAAQRFAQLILTRPGVVIGPKSISYKGQTYKPADFATSHLARWVTGAIAEAQNKAAIQNEPGYNQSLSELGLQRDISTSGLEEQRRRSILDYGDAGFAGADTLLGAQAAANPLSTSALLREAYARAQSQARQQANVAGTLFGGGLQSGLNEASRINASQTTESTRSLEDLLSALSRQRAQAEQIYSVGNTGALQQAQQRLLASGMIHAAAPPTLAMRKYKLKFPGMKKVTY